MKVFERENENVQRIVKEACELLCAARGKLCELDVDGTLQVHAVEEASCILYALYNINDAEMWLTREKGDKSNMLLRAVPYESDNVTAVN